MLTAAFHLLQLIGPRVNAVRIYQHGITKTVREND